MKKAFHILAAMLTSSFAFAQDEEAAAPPATTWGGLQMRTINMIFQNK